VQGKGVIIPHHTSTRKNISLIPTISVQGKTKVSLLPIISVQKQTEISFFPFISEQENSKYFFIPYRISTKYKQICH